MRSTSGRANRIFLQRAGIAGGRCGFDGLRVLVRAFGALPYENLTKIIKASRGYAAEARFRMPEELVEDWVAHNTGGTCYSLTYTFYEILADNGFMPELVIGDMPFGPNMHCALVVPLDGVRYLVDPGYLLTEPQPIPPRATNWIVTPMNEILLEHHSKPRLLTLYTRRNGQVKWRYRLRLEPVSEKEFMRHWDHSFEMPMMHQILITQNTEAGQIYLHNRRLQRITRDQRAVDRFDCGLEEIVHQQFGMARPVVEEALAIINQERNRANHAK